MQPQQPPYGSRPESDPYDFIVNPAAPPRRSLLPGGGSVIGRVVIVGGGLLVALILFIIVKNLLVVDSSNTALLLKVAGQQQELIHYSNEATAAPLLEGTTNNFAMTAVLSLTSQQKQLLIYLKANGHKLDAKQLNLQINAGTDQQLKASVAASTYDATFRQVMQTKLTTYGQTLQQAYAKTTGPAGRTLLKNDYATAQLLIQQLTPVRP
ncbi:MAG: hypothetical protein ABI602_03795 [Candidatus Saccharibacteria bacterium]